MPRGQTVMLAGEWTDGVMVGRQAALAEWRHRRETREFEKLCARLRARNWVRKIYAAGGDRLGLLRAYQAKWAREHRAAQLVAQKRWRHRRRVWPVVQCVGCGAVFSPWSPHGLPSIVPQYCTEACRQRARYRQRVGQTGYGNATGMVRRALADGAWHSVAELHELGLKSGTLSATLCRLIRLGEIEARGSDRQREYRSAGVVRIRRRGRKPRQRSCR